MNQSIKNVIGYASIFAILILSYSAVGYVSTYGRSIEPSSFRSFTVSGEGEVVGKPDIASFTYSVITEGGTNLADLQKKHITNSEKVNAFVKTSGVKSEDIKTQNYGVEPRYQYYNCDTRPNDGAKACPPPQIVGYTIRETVFVKVRDFEKVGDILSGAVNNGANDVSQLSFDIDDPTKVENDARMEAITKAKAKAVAIASAGGFRLGRLLSISDGGGAMPYYSKVMLGRDSGMGMGGPEMAPAPAIEPGSKDISVTVTLTYEII